MRTLFLVFALPVVLGYAAASLVPPLDREHQGQSPKPASIVFRAGTSQQWLENTSVDCIHAALSMPPEDAVQ
jgi:hypothetical protein